MESTKSGPANKFILTFIMENQAVKHRGVLNWFSPPVNNLQHFFLIEASA